MKEKNVTISWVEFDINNKETWPKDNKEKIVTIIRGEDGIPLREIWWCSFNRERAIWSNCECGEVVIAWADFPAPYGE